MNKRQKWILVFLLWASFYTILRANPDNPKKDPVDYVNPLIGTLVGGNTFPGALKPWGMVSLSPHNAVGMPSGYVYNEPWLYGFGHVHLSGTGCSELGSIIVTIIRDSLVLETDAIRTSLKMNWPEQAIIQL